MSLWRDHNFVLFWLARTVSLAGSAITTVALPILVFQLTGSAAQTALLAAMRVLPYLVFGLVAGAVADRVNRRRMMVGCDLLSVALLASLPLASLFGVLTLPHIYAVALLSASAFVWFDAANFGALPALVGRTRLVEANSLLWSSSILVEIGALALGGFMVARLGPAPTLALDALSYLASALLLLVIPKAFEQHGDRRPEIVEDRPETGSKVRSSQFAV
ncbi:MAG: MFS transporter, partial [Chloroflexaceae bacterium]|nr:MFS transporter [Chloroflexaceae bacterium]